LLEIQEDFELNSADLEDMAADLEEILQNIVILLEQSALSAPQLTVAELNDRFSHIIRMPTFIPVNRACAKHARVGVFAGYIGVNVRLALRGPGPQPGKRARNNQAIDQCIEQVLGSC